MALNELLSLKPYLKFLPTVKQVPQKSVWLTYDQEADVMYINFKKPSVASDSELTEDDVIIRYDGEEVIGLTILHASQR